MDGWIGGWLIPGMSVWPSKEEGMGKGWGKDKETKKRTNAESSFLPCHLSPGCLLPPWDGGCVI